MVCCVAPKVYVSPKGGSFVYDIASSYSTSRSEPNYLTVLIERLFQRRMSSAIEVAKKWAQCENRLLGRVKETNALDFAELFKIQRQFIETLFQLKFDEKPVSHLVEAWQKKAQVSPEVFLPLFQLRSSLLEIAGYSYSVRAKLDPKSFSDAYLSQLRKPTQVRV